MSGWLLWRLSRPALVLVLTVEAVVASITVLQCLTDDWSGHQITVMGVLAGLSVVYGEATARMDRLRRYLAEDSPFIDQTSVWVFAGALVLPGGAAALLTALIYLHILIRSRGQSRQPHRIIYTAATMVAATLAANATYTAVAAASASWVTGPLTVVGVAAALTVFRLVNDGLVAAVMFLAARPDRIRDLLLPRDQFIIETATVLLGAITAVLLTAEIWLVPAVCVFMALIHRSSIVTQVQQAAIRDGRTGLLTAGAWSDHADRELARAARAGQPVTLLLLDLDHFKRINDSYGHLAGDTVLTAVAACLSGQLRGHDAVGRYGGEEFAALLAGVDEHAAAQIANRVTDAIRRLDVPHGEHLLQVTASVGHTTTAAGCAGLRDLLATADAALYAAKAAGRDRAMGAVADAMVTAG